MRIPIVVPGRGFVAILVAMAVWATRISAADTPPSRAAETVRDEIVFGGDADFPPYEYLDARGNPAGLNVDLIRAIGRVKGWRVRFDLRPWSQVRARLLSGEIGVATMYRWPQRAQEVDFAIPHELIYHEMFIPKGQPPVLSLSNLVGKRILVQSDTLSVDRLRELGYDRELRPVASEPEALAALARGEGDVAVVTQTAGRPFRERERLADRITPTGPPILLSEYGFVARKGQRALIDQLSEGVASVKASGEYERMYNLWIRPDRSAVRARQIAWVLSGVVFIALGIGVWNRALRRRVRLQTAALERELAEKERALAALAESERTLRQTQKMEAIGRLAGGVAHDFNNILTIIINYGRLLRDDLADAGRDTADADEILAASERAARLTKQLLAFSRATPMEVVGLDLCLAAQKMKPMIQSLVGDNVVVEVGTLTRPVIVEADPTQIDQILLNLAANARDAMPHGGRLSIGVATRALEANNELDLPAADYAALTVADNGVGMDRETMGRIFEPFFTTKAIGKGTGLGLATVMAHATKLGGKVGVASTPGRGTRFDVLLPLGHRREDAGANSAPGAALDPLRHARHETILLVEDDEALRRAARLILERAGYRVVEARDGEDAVEIAAADPTITLLMTDVIMPRCNGLQLVSELRRRRPDLLVLFVSGYVGDDETIDLTQPGTAFLAKPYTPEDLLPAMHRLFDAAPPSVRPTAEQPPRPASPPG